ncbi:hypothetical protein [Roseibium sp.]|uniref:hypothetical protein n=1 Tax=Roseibium sp. TaxID=1936156 RepID=UPI003BAC9D73
MAHIRQQIREAVYAVLDPLPRTSGNCHLMRTYPTDGDRTPSLLVYVLRERSELSGMGGDDRTMSRFLDVTIEAQARGRDFDDKLDDIAVDVEKAMFSNRFFGGLARNSQLVETVLDLGSDRDHRRSGVLIMRYQIETDGPEANPEITD